MFSEKSYFNKKLIKTKKDIEGINIRHQRA